MKKRFLILIICGCALLGMIVSASGSASQDHTVISKSYLEGPYLQELVSIVSDQVAAGASNTRSAALQSLNTLGQSYLDQLKPNGRETQDWLTAGSFTAQGGERGDTVTLAPGSGLIWISGAADFTGTLIDLTVGRELQRGALEAGHRYVAGTECLVTLSSGTAYWSVEGRWLTTSDGVTVPAISFVDVPMDSSFYDAVCYVVERGLFVGTSDTEFSPYVTINRGMMATVLHRLAGTPTTVYTPVFSDVPDGRWYTPGVIWAAESTVVKGMGDGTYRPAEDLTHQQIAVMFYNYANWIGIDTSAQADLSTVPGGNTVSSWAKEAVSWAVSVGIMPIDSETPLAAKEPANRAQVAIMLQRFDALISL